MGESKESVNDRRFKAHPGWHVLGGALVAGWLLTMAVLFWPGRGEAEVSLDGAAALVPVEGEEWMGAFLGGRRIGSVHSRTTRDGEGWRVDQESTLRLRAGELKQRLSTALSVRLDGRYRLRSFELSADSGPIALRSRGEVEPGALRVTLSLGGEIIERRLALREAPLLDLALPRLLAGQDLQPGRRYRVTVFDPQALSNAPVSVEVVGWEALPFEGQLTPAVHLRRQTAGVALDTWLDGKGRVLKEQTSLGLTLSREDGTVKDDAGDGDAELDPGAAGELLRQLGDVPGAVGKDP
jgi:hypothetical protein